MTNRSGLLVVLEGPDGGGKSSVAPAVVEHLRAKGYSTCHHVREPGGTAVGERIRGILLDASLAEMERSTETLLYLSARAELLGKVIGPALRRDEAIVCERFLLSTIVYQGVAGGVDPNWIRDCFRPTSAGIVPDLTVVLDVPPEIGLARRGPTKDRLERRDLEYHRRVRQGFLDAVRDDPIHVKRVDATATREEVIAATLREVDDVLRHRRRAR
ncbi:MAG: dTMP kinase [Planctomycetes bacterium]|nr:dTMP kinase [Planctomycetota bacterium]MBI3845817.1 dTMP kinase [Planctomycetota bacterium]